VSHVIESSQSAVLTLSLLLNDSHPSRRVQRNCKPNLIVCSSIDAAQWFMVYCVTLETCILHCSRATFMTEFAKIVITFSDFDLSKLSKVLVKICCKQCLNVVNHVTRIKRFNFRRFGASCTNIVVVFNIYKIIRKDV